MTVENGRQRQLVIAGLFDGMCGEVDGDIAFIPNLRRKRASEVTRGLLDGDPVLLKLKRRPSPADPFAVFTYRRLDE